MKSVARKILTSLGILAVALTFCTMASAQCAGVDLDQLKGGLLHKQAFKGFDSDSARLQSIDDDLDPIVGFWKVSFDADFGNIDSAFVQWHSDGTEIMNSKRQPSTGSFCLGVWKKVARGQYVLNHYAISWNADNTLLGITNFHETITLKDKDHYTGAFAITQYDSAGNEIGGVSGNITAFRIKTDTVITHL